MKRLGSKVAFITGGNGFIGSNLIKALVKENYDIHILLRKNANLWRIKDFTEKITIHKGDILEKEKLVKIVAKISPGYLFHLASYGNTSADTNLQEMVNVNILGLINLLEATKKTAYKSFVITGSSSEYGFKKAPMKETDILTPNSYYSATKASATLLAQNFAQINNKPITIARLFSVYGPYEENNRLIPTVINSALQSKTILTTAGSVRRDFIYIDDVISGLLKITKTNLRPGEIINLGTGKQHDNKDVIKTVGKILDKHLVVEYGRFPKRGWDTSNWVANILKAKKLLGWNPKYNLGQGLTETINWYRKNN